MRPIRRAFLVLCLAAFAGCGGYGEVSPKTYEYATALHSICSRKDPARLDKFTAMLANAEAAGEVPPREADWLRTIADTARGGDWDDARADARRMLADQVREGF